MITITVSGFVSKDQIKGSERMGSLFGLEDVITAGESPLTSWVVVYAKLESGSLVGMVIWKKIVVVGVPG